MPQFYPNNNKPPQENQASFPQDMSGPHRVINKDTYGNVDKTKMGHLHMRRQGL